MVEVRLDGKRIRVGDESRPLLSGEVHYWRLDPARWPAILDAVQDLGLDVISTYVCWQHHEISPSRRDFTGQTDPTRDLVRFLELVAARDLWLLLRPGPYIYAEWVNMGVPDRVAGYHRLHPAFLREAEAYMADVVAAARPFFATRGGPVVLLQAENEPDMWPQFYADQLGLGSVAGPFQAFLREHYGGDMAALNAAWESDLDTFAAARAVTRPVIETRGYLNRYLDYRRFQYWYTAEIGRWAAQTYRDLGVEVPIYLNTYPSHGMQNWRAIAAAGVAGGPDYYAVNEFRRDSWEHREFLHLLRYARTYGALPLIPEFQAGNWHGWHYHSGVLTPAHYWLAALSALLAGIAGWNWYMLVNRDNWYMAPINEYGRAHPELVAVFKRIVDLFRTVDPPALEKLTHTGIALDVLDRSSEIGGFRDPVTDALYAADIDYECYDAATGEIARPVLFFAGGRWLDRDAQARLLVYVEAGGHLVFFQNLPQYDAQLNPANDLGLHAPDGVREGAPVRVCLGDRRNPHVEDDANGCPGDYLHAVTLTPATVFEYDAPPGIPIRAERLRSGAQMLGEEAIHHDLLTGTVCTVGYHERRGAGTITVLGLPPAPEIVAGVLRWLAIPIPSRARAPHISTALFARGADRVLIAVNNGAHDQHTLIDLEPSRFEDAIYRVDEVAPADDSGGAPLLVRNLHRAPVIPLAIPAKGGRALVITPGGAE